MKRIVLMYSTHRPTQGHVQALQQLVPGGEVVVAQDEEHAVDVCRKADLIVGHRYLRQALPEAKQLSFVQSTAAGIDRLPLDELVSRKVRLCRCTVASPTIARHAVTCAWAITRALPTAFSRQQAREWRADFQWPSEPKRAVVVGAGSIGQAIARLLSREGIEVAGVRRSVPAEPIDGFDAMYRPQALPSVLPECDWCFIAAPLTEQTRNLFDADLLKKLKRSAVLVNVGRGEVIDSDALCGLMAKGHLAGAALDVLSPEAKHVDHPVWTTPRLILTPHVASHCAERPTQLEAFAEKQVSAYLSGETLVDEVDLSDWRTPNDTD